MQGFTFIAAFLMGLTGSLHCAGMCGPIMMVLQFQALKGWKRWAGILLYHFSRVTIYALLALALYSFSSIFDPRWQQYISMSLGIVLLVAGLFTFLNVPGSAVTLPWAGYVKRRLAKFIGSQNLLAFAVAGSLNGMLPCGLVYMALSAGAVAANAYTAAILMYAFGLGTMPMLVAITVFRSRMSFIRTINLKKFVPVTMFVFGVVFLVRGMNLGIPLLSPKIQVEHHEVHVSCCHKSE